MTVTTVWHLHQYKKISKKIMHSFLIWNVRGREPLQWLMTESVCSNQLCYTWVHQVSLFSISMFYLCVQKTFSTSICQRRIILQMTECQDSKKLHFWSFENKKQILLIDHDWEKLLTTSWCQIIFQTDFLKKYDTLYMFIVTPASAGWSVFLQM